MNGVNGRSHDINSERGEEGVSLMFTGGSGGPVNKNNKIGCFLF